MKKKECDIVRDLMVLYRDDACSDASKGFVEEHLESCGECKKIYEQSSKELSLELPEEEKQEMEERLGMIFKRSIKKWKWKHTVIGCMVLCVVLVGFAIFERSGVKQKLYAVPSESIEVAEIYELSTGDIFFTLHSDVPVYRQTSLGVPSGGKADPFASVDYGIQYMRNSLIGRSFVDDFEYPWDISYIYGPEKTEPSGYQERGDEFKGNICSRIFYEGAGKRDVLDIWKSGDDIQKAPDEIERAALYEYGSRELYERAETVARHLKLDGEELMGLLGNETAPDDLGRHVEWVVNVRR